MGEAAAAAADEGKVYCGNPFTGHTGKAAPHPAVVGATATFPQGGRLVCQKTSTLLYRECRGDHWSPASLAQQRSFGKASHKANGHGRAMLAPTGVFRQSDLPPRGKASQLQICCSSCNPSRRPASSASTSSAVLSAQKLTRRAVRTVRSAQPMASRVWLGSPLSQAEPPET